MLLFRFQDEFMRAVEGVSSHLTKKTPNQGLWVVGEMSAGHKFMPKMVRMHFYDRFDVVYLKKNIAVSFYSVGKYSKSSPWYMIKPGACKV